MSYSMSKTPLSTTSKSPVSSPLKGSVLPQAGVVQTLVVCKPAVAHVDCHAAAYWMTEIICESGFINNKC